MAVRSRTEMHKSLHRLVAILFVVTSLSCTAAPLPVKALILVDMDGTIGVQSPTVPDFAAEHRISVPNDPEGDFYLYPGALEFLRTLFAWNKSEVALFTMGFGPRNEIVRDFIASKLSVDVRRFPVYDYSYAVFSEELVERYKTNDPSLSQGWRDYFASLPKPIVHLERLPEGRRYFKDLSKIAPLYAGLSVDNIRLVDDNEHAVPDSQKSQLLVFGPRVDYTTATKMLQRFVEPCAPIGLDIEPK